MSVDMGSKMNNEQLEERRRKIFSCLLLALLSLSFTIENNILFEGEIAELAEKSELESEPKDKKITPNGIELPETFYGSLADQKAVLTSEQFMHLSHSEVLTPPPEHV